MANYEYNQTTGIVVPDTSEVKQQVQEEYRTALGEDLDISDSTPQGRLIEAETVARKRVIENMALIANMYNKDQAYGIFLDSLASLFSIERVGATRTIALCQVTGTANTVIPAGSQIQDNEGNIYYSEADITIGSDGNGQGYFYSMNKGAISCPANSLTQIVTAVLGWSTVNNASAGSIGDDEESDSSLRDRIDTDQFIGSAIPKAIKSEVMRLEGVEDCLVIDNSASTADTTSITGVTIPAHSLFICVEGGNSKDIANAIFLKKSGGCGYTTGTGQTVTESVKDELNDQTYAVSFDRPVYVDIDVEVELAVGQATTATEAQIKQTIVNYSEGKIAGVEGLTIGKNVSPFEIASAITAEVPDVYIASVKIAKNGETASAEEIEIAANEKATISADNITIS